MIVEKIEKIVNQNPNKIIYKVNSDNITYEKLWDMASYYANLIIKEGNSPVIIYGSNQLEMFISIFACLIANRTYVPLGLCTPINRLKKIVKTTGSSLILTNEILNINDVHCTDLNGLIKFKSYKNHKQISDIVYIIFTSGSTGEPKGVPISQSNLNNFISWISDLNPLKNYKDANILNQASFSFDLSVASIYYSICNGHTLISLDNELKTYDKMFELLYEQKINIAMMTPTFAKLLLLNDDFNSNNYPNLKCIYFCGELLENKTVRKLFEKFPNIKIINAYGPTEATSAVSGIMITKDMLDMEEILPVGDMNNNATEIIIDNDEIVLKGDSVFSGYLNNHIGGYYKENNINCYRTGDTGYIKHNKLYCKGRIDNQIKYMGYRIEIHDIEKNISNIHGIRDCVVIAKYNENHLVKMIKAYVVVESDQYNEFYIKTELGKLVPEYMMPKIIKIVDELPINKNGKLDRRMLSYS